MTVHDCAQRNHVHVASGAGAPVQLPLAVRIAPTSGVPPIVGPLVMTGSGGSAPARGAWEPSTIRAQSAVAPRIATPSPSRRTAIQRSSIFIAILPVVQQDIPTVRHQNASVGYPTPPGPWAG